jgi:hypothetical protein
LPGPAGDGDTLLTCVAGPRGLPHLHQYSYHLVASGPRGTNERLEGVDWGLQERGGQHHAQGASCTIQEAPSSGKVDQQPKGWRRALPVSQRPRMLPLGWSCNLVLLWVLAPGRPFFPSSQGCSPRSSAMCLSSIPPAVHHSPLLEQTQENQRALTRQIRADNVQTHGGSPVDFLGGGGE